MKQILSLLALVCIASAACAAEPAPAKIEYNRDVRPILSDKCFKCHGPDAKARKAELRLDLRDNALADHDGARPIVPKQADKSEVVRRIETDDEDDLMPPKKSNLHLSKKRNRRAAAVDRGGRGISGALVARRAEGAVGKWQNADGRIGEARSGARGATQEMAAQFH